MWSIALDAARKVAASPAMRMGLLAIALLLSVAWHVHRVRTLEASVRRAEEALAVSRAAHVQDLATIGALKSQIKRNDSATADLQRLLAKSQHSATLAMRAIEAAPAADDGPIAPVLAHALDALRGPP